MAKPSKKDEARDKPEAQALFEYTVRRMLSTPPRPHKPKARSKKSNSNTPQRS
jgi:hypothetical protein